MPSTQMKSRYLALVPSPLSGFDLFNYMGPMVFCRGQSCTTAVMEQLISEIEEHVKNGTSTYPVKEEFRVFWEGIACWPYLSHNLKTLKKYGINVCATAYAKAWALDYESGDMDGLARVYSFNSSNNILIDETVKRRVEWNKKFHTSERSRVRIPLGPPKTGLFVQACLFYAVIYTKGCSLVP